MSDRAITKVSNDFKNYNGELVCKKLIEKYNYRVKKVKEKIVKKIHQLTNNKLRDLYETRFMSDDDIGKLYDVSGITISNYRRKYNIKSHSSNLKKKGLITIKQAALKYNLSWDAMSRTIKKNDLDIIKKQWRSVYYNEKDVELII